MEDNYDVELMCIEMIESIGPERALLKSQNDLFFMDDRKFATRYRLSKQVVLNILEKIEGRLEHSTNRNKPLTPVQQLLLALRFYATGSLKVVAGELTGLSKSSVCRYLRKVSEAIASLAPQYIKFPDQSESKKIVQDFHRIGKFPRVIGVIGCTHIAILNPGGPNAEDFRNGNGYHSINVQIISDSDLMIRNIVARWPGATEDNDIFDNSRVRTNFESGRIRDCYLLGGNQYKLSTYLLTPFLNTVNVMEENYNKSHLCTRYAIEELHGLWKRRFPSLKQTLRTKLQTSLTIIISTAVLHNIAIQTGEEEPPEDEELHQYFQEQKGRQGDETFELPPVYDDFEEPISAYRQTIVEKHFSQL